MHHNNQYLKTALTSFFKNLVEFKEEPGCHLGLESSMVYFRKQQQHSLLSVIGKKDIKPVHPCGC
jgi:hypothetical protein